MAYFGIDREILEEIAYCSYGFTYEAMEHLDDAELFMEMCDTECECEAA